MNEPLEKSNSSFLESSWFCNRLEALDLDLVSSLISFTFEPPLDLLLLILDLLIGAGSSYFFLPLLFSSFSRVLLLEVFSTCFDLFFLIFAQKIINQNSLKFK